MVALSSVENALRTTYLSVLKEQLNTAHPLIAAIKHTSGSVWGKDIRKCVKGEIEIVAPLCNLYSKLTISDEVARIATQSMSLFVAILNSKMEEIIDKSKTDINEKLIKGEDCFMGLKQLFDIDKPLYGLDREKHEFLKPYLRPNFGEMSWNKLQKEIDYLSEKRNSEIDFIICSYSVKRAYQNYLVENKINMDIIVLKDGWKAISHNGIPVVPDRHCPEGVMYLLNTKHFTINQLCDWRWLEDCNGIVLRQNPGETKHTATLVKYANIICDSPASQGMISGITEAGK